MVFDLLAMAMLDGSWFYSPFIIPVAGCAMILGIVASGAWARVRSLEIKSQERLARIAHGLPVEPDWDQATAREAAQVAGQMTPAAPKPHGRPKDGSGARRAGMVLVSVGVGLFAFFAALTMIVQVREVLSGGAAGLIPFAIGIGFLIDARLKKREFERYMEMERFGGWNAGALGSPVPPPPPAGMTAAQASDWRPSSTLK